MEHNLEKLDNLTDCSMKMFLVNDTEGFNLSEDFAIYKEDLIQLCGKLEKYFNILLGEFEDGLLDIIN